MNECSTAQNATNSRCAKEVRTKLYGQIRRLKRTRKSNAMTISRGDIQAISRWKKKSEKKTTTNKQTSLNDNKRIVCAVMNACGLFAMSKA